MYPMVGMGPAIARALVPHGWDRSTIASALYHMAGTGLPFLVPLYRMAGMGPAIARIPLPHGWNGFAIARAPVPHGWNGACHC